jgi:hypothetical protein
MDQEYERSMDQKRRRFEQQERNYQDVPEGLVELLRRALAEKGDTSRAVITCRVDHFGCLEDEDKGWGCGWRNIQMLFSNLIQNEDYRKAIFGGDGENAYVPNIVTLQRWLESAWEKGFDVEGAKQMEWRILDTPKWIGTTECCALLRSFGIRAQIAEFEAVTAKEGKLKGRKGGHHTKPQVEDDDISIVSGSKEAGNQHSLSCDRCNKHPIGPVYYRCTIKENYNICPDCKDAVKRETIEDTVGRLNHFVRMKTSDADSDDELLRGGEARPQAGPKLVNMHTRLLEWVWKYFTSGSAYNRGPNGDAGCAKEQDKVLVVDRAPLYFQQQGHSRTIVGVRKEQRVAGGPEETFLILLEPCEETRELARLLREEGWQDLFEFGTGDLWKPVYQICFLKPGIATGEELERLKKLSSYNYRS